MYKIGQRVAVCGGGPIGQLVLQCVKRFGATSLTMIEPVRERRGTAARYGAEFTIDPSSGGCGGPVNGDHPGTGV